MHAGVSHLGLGQEHPLHWLRDWLRQEMEQLNSSKVESDYSLRYDTLILLGRNKVRKLECPYMVYSVIQVLY